MMSLKVICLAFVLGAFSLLVRCDKDELIFLAAIARHGARHMANPEYYHITNDTSFLRNPGRLTNVGKHQLYLLGRQLADTYVKEYKLLSMKYNPKQIVVRSSGINRTIESAQSLLAGLYQPGTGPSMDLRQLETALPPIHVENLEEIQRELRDSALPYYMRTIPVHTSTAVNDYLFSPHTECDTVAEDEEDYEDEFAEINKRYTDFYSKLKNKYGLDVDSTLDVYKLYDNIVSAQGNAVKLNINLDSEDLAKLREIANVENLQIFPRSDLKVKLLSHVLLSDIRKHFTRAVTDQAEDATSAQDRLRMALFQISDAHILALNRLFPLKLNSTVVFASILLFELHKVTDNSGNVQYRIKAIYNGQEVDLGKLRRYEEFMAHLEDNTYEDDEDFKKNCFEGYDAPPFDRDTYVAITVILFIIFLLIWGSNWFILTRKEKESTTENSESLVEPTTGVLNSSVNEPNQVTINPAGKSSTK